MQITRESSGRLYAVLEVPKEATQTDIKRAYHKKALQIHPDKTGGTTTEEFKAVQEAYAILSDPEKRALYDKFGRVGMAKLEQFGMGEYAANIIANKRLLVAILIPIPLLFILQLLFILFAAIKVDYGFDHWRWIYVFVPNYLQQIIFFLPVAIVLLMSKEKRMTCLGLFLLCQIIVFFLLPRSMDAEANRVDIFQRELAEAMKQAAKQTRSKDGGPETLLNLAAINSLSSSQFASHPHTFISRNDFAAFYSWRTTFYAQYIAMIFYLVWKVMGLTVSDVKRVLKSEIEAEGNAAMGTNSEGDYYERVRQVEALTRASPLYISYVFWSIFDMACTVAFVLFLKMRLCGDLPMLSFYIIFAPIFLSVGLFPLLQAVRQWICYQGSSTCCVRMLTTLSILFFAYLSMFTFLLLSEHLERTYLPDNTLAIFVRSIIVGKDAYAQPPSSEIPPPPTLFLTFSLIITMLTIIILTASCIIYSVVVNAIQIFDAVSPTNDEDEEGGENTNNAAGAGYQNVNGDDGAIPTDTTRLNSGTAKGGSKYGAV